MEAWLGVALRFVEACLVLPLSMVVALMAVRGLVELVEVVILERGDCALEMELLAGSKGSGSVALVMPKEVMWALVAMVAMGERMELTSTMAVMVALIVARLVMLVLATTALEVERMAAKAENSSLIQMAEAGWVVLVAARVARLVVRVASSWVRPNRLQPGQAVWSGGRDGV